MNKGLLIVLILTITSGFTYARSIEDITFQVYSMVFSGKYYVNNAERKMFFWSVPFSFRTEMTVNSQTDQVSLNFVAAKQGGSFYTDMKEQGKVASNSEFSKVFGFNEDFTNLVMSFTSSLDPKSGISLNKVRSYQNNTFKSYELKFIVNGDKLNKSLYVTFDLTKTTQSKEDIGKWEDYLQSRTKPLPPSKLSFLEETN